MRVKFEPNQRILVRAVVGPSGECEDGIFVRVNTDDPEIFVALSDAIIITPEIKKALKVKRD